MNTRSFFFGLATGIAAAVFIQKSVSTPMYKQPESVLHKVKTLFKKEGPISGSWIEMKTQDYAKGPVVYTVYKGGITRLDDNDTQQWEFIADAKTGVILDLYLI
ncbi:hypothetical protein GCM10008967_24310 [Bacillus carboniphilus]|uniref:PepSY domain-containing protein n=1 Tax=Bacillus carboniphilus TaxID=86663 RepID=A0ABP3G2V3_9BACI